MRSYYAALLAAALRRGLWRAGNNAGTLLFFGTLVATLALAAIGLGNAAVAQYLEDTFSNRIVAVVPSVVLLIGFLGYEFLAQNYENVRDETSAAVAARTERDGVAAKYDGLERQYNDRAPLLRWQSPVLWLEGDGTMRLLVYCTNVGGETARIRKANASSSSDEKLLQLSAEEGTDIYPGVEYRFKNIAVLGRVGVLGNKTVTWSVCYSDNAGKSYDTIASVHGIFTPGVREAGIADKNLDETNAAQRHAAHVGIGH